MVCCGDNGIVLLTMASKRLSYTSTRARRARAPHRAGAPGSHVGIVFAAVNVAGCEPGAPATFTPANTMPTQSRHKRRRMATHGETRRTR